MFFLFLAGIGLNGFETLSLVYVTEISGKINAFLKIEERI
jgi:hypothetical protein